MRGDGRGVKLPRQVMTCKWRGARNAAVSVLERCRRATFDGVYLRVWNVLFGMEKFIGGGWSHCKMF